MLHTILSSRYIIRGLNKKDMEQIAENTLNLENAMEVENYLSNVFSDTEQDNHLNCNDKKGV